MHPTNFSKRPFKRGKRKAHKNVEHSRVGVMMLNTKQDNSSIIVVHLYSVLLNNIWVVFSHMFVFWWVHVNYVYRNLTVKLQQQLNACLMRLTECFLSTQLNYDSVLVSTVWLISLLWLSLLPERTMSKAKTKLNSVGAVYSNFRLWNCRQMWEQNSCPTWHSK